MRIYFDEENDVEIFIELCKTIAKIEAIISEE